MTITRLLVANRGEIARRVFRTAHAMGIESVAVYADPDRDAPHVREADHAIALPGSTSRETYLNVEAVLRAATVAAADAVHPGYGFLSENAAFARAVIEAGMTWVGPTPDAIDAMGDKLIALQRMQEAGVPTLPRHELGADADDEQLLAAGSSVGYPVMVKASAGGGGKGMRVVGHEHDLVAAIQTARRESESAFGSPVVFLERFVARARHIEVQIFGDVDGTVRHLFERECSVQRRHQKVLEESPSSFVDDDLRRDICAAAVAAGSAVDYRGAGTVEFVVGEDRRYYFLEMNTRLQVEHPVTEMITGVDLVRQQLLVAAGLPAELPEQLEQTGSAIEVRLYAEDPERDFLPQTGTLVAFTPPPDVRFDSGVERGSVVTPHFDPMLAKVVAHGPNRVEAAAMLGRALRAMRIHGVITNRDLLVNVLEHPAFLSGDTTTDFFERHAPQRRRVPNGDEIARAALVAAIADRERWRAGLDPRREVPGSLPAGFRNYRASGLNLSYLVEDQAVDVECWEERDGLIRARVADNLVQARLVGGSEHELDLELDGERVRANVSRAGEQVWVGWLGLDSALALQPRFPEPERGAVKGGLVAPMNGTIVMLEATEGDHVEAGQMLVVIEAMKMEHRLVAPADGVVLRVLTSAGASVSTDDVLVVVRDEDDEGSEPTPESSTTEAAL